MIHMADIDTFIWYSLVSMVVAGLSILNVRRKDPGLTMVNRVLVLLLFVGVTGSLLTFYNMFMTSDLSLYYVWQYTSSDLPMLYKVSGVIAGRGGSLLFWIWLILLPWTIEEMRAWLRETRGTGMSTSIPSDSATFRWTRAGVMAILVPFFYILSLHEMFKETTADLLFLKPDGNGLNPILQTELMVIHPPIVFVAYGLMAVPFAAAFAHLITGEKRWWTLSLTWSRIAWLFLTLGIGIGALWAYVVLGWGGYWAWDPVETSSLLPWFTMTGLLHAQLMYKRRKEFPILTPILAIMTFVLIVFATFATRAGGLWVSVHTFGSADVAISPWDRFVDVLETGDGIWAYVLFMAGSLFIMDLLAVRRWAQLRPDKPVVEEGVEPVGEVYYTLDELAAKFINDMSLMKATIYLSIIATMVTFLILVWGVDGLDPAEFDSRVGVVVIFGVLALFMCLTWRDLGRGTMLKILGLSLIASLIGHLAFPEIRPAGAYIPIILIALLGSIQKVVLSFNRKRPWLSMRVVSVHLIHVGLILVLLGYVGSSYMLEEESISVVADGHPVSSAGFMFEVTDPVFTSDENLVTVDIWEGGKHIGRSRPGLILVSGQARNEIRVVDTLGKDIYLTYESASVVSYDGFGDPIYEVNLNVKILPLMKMLWGGMWMMSFGIVLRMVVEAFPGRSRSRVSTGAVTDHGPGPVKGSSKGDEGEPIEDGPDRVDDGVVVSPGSDGDAPTDSAEGEAEEGKDDDYYDDLLEKELEGL